MAKKVFKITTELEIALDKALNEPTLTDALSSIVLWEHLRIHHQMRRGAPVASYFQEVISLVMKAYIWTPSTPEVSLISKDVIRLPKTD